jgi:hypothetical protein
MIDLALWSFENDLEDWAQSTTNVMNTEINSVDGYIHGTVLGENPFVDSPLLDLEVTDRHMLVIRMAYDGKCNLARVLLERGHAAPTPTVNRKNAFINPVEIRFPITSDAAQHIYYVPLYDAIQGAVTRIRFFPCSNLNQIRSGQSFEIDWIMVAKGTASLLHMSCLGE